MRKQLFIAIAVLLGGFVLAGASCKEQQPAQTALLGCETVTAELNILLPLRRDGALPDKVVELIDKQRAITDPYCLGPAPDVNADLVNIAVDGAARTLSAIVSQYSS